MNIIELRDRLSEIIKENDARFPAEFRNEQKVYAHYKVSTRVSVYAPVRYAEGSLYMFVNGNQGFNLELDMGEAIEYGRNNPRQ